MHHPVCDLSVVSQMSSPGGKIRGCFQCSKRRIICDNAEPTCKKCQKKGIECSGPGRIRFSTGVAQRGRLRGSTLPVVDPSPEPTLESNIQATPVPRRIRWKSDQPARATRKNVKGVGSGSSTRQATSISIPRNGNAIPVCTETFDLQRNDPDDNNEHIDRPSHKALIPVTGSIHQWLAPLNSQTRMLMSHFSEQVAPVMVLLDHISNGYRNILLPLACEDELVQRAVAVVAAQHLALHSPSYQSFADQSRATLISRLCRDSTSPDRVFTTSTWATLIVLLVGETITGSSEYAHLLRTLTSLVQNADQIAPSSARQFLSQQTHMFEFLGQPLLGEHQGVDVLSLPLERYLDWTCYDLPAESEHNHMIHLSRMAFIKASQIYLGRVASNDHQWQLLESMKELVSQIEPNQMGSHALVWVCFIAAADSTDPEHRSFFVDRMNLIFAKTKFHNIPAGVQALPAIWSEQASSRWTKSLSRLAPMLIIAILSPILSHFISDMFCARVILEPTRAHANGCNREIRAVITYAPSKRQTKEVGGGIATNASAQISMGKESLTAVYSHIAMPVELWDL